jgi:hypothetical protein
MRIQIERKRGQIGASVTGEMRLHGSLGNEDWFYKTNIIAPIKKERPGSRSSFYS